MTAAVRTVIGWRTLEAIKEETRGGYRRGKSPWRGAKGRPKESPITPDVRAKINELRGQGWSIRKICAEVGLSVQTVWKLT